jgi:ABC-type nitrate/sulfonate/bicarbonate transport system ATPase subunit
LSDTQTAGDASQFELRIDTKTYVSADGASVEVIRGLHLRLEAGAFGVLIGHSGCGKTTVLHIAAGLDSNFTGERHLPGNGNLGIVFQEPRLLPWRTVADNIRLALPAHESITNLDDLIDTLGLGSYLTRYPGELSLGLARRTAIARAFAVRPKVLLLDEPFVSLDPSIAAALKQELIALTARDGITTLMVTHDLNDAIQLADRLFFLSTKPASIVAEISLPPPRGARSREAMATIAAELKRVVPQHVAGLTGD